LSGFCSARGRAGVADLAGVDSWTGALAGSELATGVGLAALRGRRAGALF
jgi:hypothetical protein